MLWADGTYHLVLGNLALGLPDQGGQKGAGEEVMWFLYD